MAKKQGFQIFSVFGLIEDAASQHMIREYPQRCRKIEKSQFGLTPEECPELYVNALGQEVQYVILVPGDLIPEYEETIAGLRS